MPSVINSDNGVVSGTAGLKSSADNSGVLDLQTNGTTAISISASQVVTFANQPAYTGGTANGVLYLNASKVLTSGSALVFDGTNLGVGVSSPSTIIHAKASGNYGTIFIDNSSTTGGGAFAARQNGSTKAILGVSGAIEGNTSSDAGLFSETGGGIRLYVNGSGTAVARITSGGQLLVGTTSSIGTATVGRLQVLGGGTYVTTNSEAGGFVGVNSNADNSLALVADVDNLRSGSHIAFYVDGFSEKMRLDASGNLGLGVTPSAWGGPFDVIQAGTYGQHFAGQTNAPDLKLGTNNYYNGSSYVYTVTGSVAMQMNLGNNVFNVASAPSGTANAAITWTPIIAVATNQSLALQGATSQSGTGITFPATQAASSDANTLDDYEEGTWTPSIGSTSGVSGVSAGTHWYRKVGSLVVVTGVFSYTSATAGAAYIVCNLPFSMSANSDPICGVCNSYPYDNNRQSGIVLDNSSGNPNDVYIGFYVSSTNAGNVLWSLSYRST